MPTPIAGVSSMATRLILGELAQRYEAASGVPVAIRAMGGVDAAALVRAGEPTDIVVLASGPMAKLEAEGQRWRPWLWAAGGVAVLAMFLRSWLRRRG